MEPPPQQHESPAKVAASDPVKPRSLARFKDLARKLFAVDREEFRRALEKDEKARRAKRGR